MLYDKFMNDPQILEIIENLKGRKPYEEKRASKLGFSSLYSYIEDKILKKKLSEDADINKVDMSKDENVEHNAKKKKNNCSCC
tara:strand:+ start:512 stop:760 length:249 start_codon:yes stop_codon:yes gene_type:complete